MSNSVMWVLDLLKKQGLSFVLLGFAVWYFYFEVHRLEEKSDRCNEKMMMLYQGVILQNVQLLQKVEKQLEEGQEIDQRMIRSMNRK